MKFDCGPTPAQRKQARRDYLHNWHPYFAWRPICLGPNDCRWLETVLRKGERYFRSDWDSECYIWEYKAMEEQDSE
jgi:hypothetical protein